MKYLTYIFFIYIFCTFYVELSAHQDVEPVTREIHIHEEGVITYITSGMYYTDLGKNNGTSIGDSLEVKSKTETIGYIKITNLSKKSSIGNALWIKTPLSIGDRVILDKTTVEILEPSEPEITVEKDSVAEVSIVDTDTPIIEGKKEEKTPNFKLVQRGKIAVRGTVFGNQYSGTKLNWENRKIGTLNYNVSMQVPVRLSLAMYGRSTSDPSNNELTYSLYHLQLGYDSPKGTYSGQIGRIYASNLSGIGLVDGMLMQYKLSGKYAAGAVVGSQPDIETNKVSTDNIRTGAYISWYNRSGKLNISGNIAGIGQYRNTSIDREFLYLQNHLRFRRWISFFFSGELDLDRKNKSENRDFAELTSLNGTLRLKPYKWFSISSRYSARKNVIYLVNQSTIPDSLFSNQLRTGWFNSIRFTPLQDYSFQLGYSYRSQENARKASNLYSISVNSRNLMSTQITLRGGFSILDNEQIRAYRSRISTSTTLLKSINLFFEYELYQYQYGGVGDRYNRHSLSTDISINYSNHIYLSFLVERSWEKDLNYYDLFGEISYRF